MSLTLSKIFYDKMDLRLFYFHVIICFGRIIRGTYAKLESFCYLQETQWHYFIQILVSKLGLKLHLFQLTI